MSNTFLGHKCIGRNILVPLSRQFLWQKFQLCIYEKIFVLKNVQGKYNPPCNQARGYDKISLFIYAISCLQDNGVAEGSRTKFQYFALMKKTYYLRYGEPLKP